VSPRRRSISSALPSRIKDAALAIVRTGEAWDSPFF
jgi:hypothetical protein